ncbi:phosphotransferase [Curtobacterium sp. ISL-83]|uniref:phosphotransferase n=1 Tax=Curtobacterium sp. ISL-83 TaxID=2819145 RepID=UPI001BEBBCCA|nr:phosphotransferase [Curtobacterium sp. ISL-83]MBT2501111.1 phosphotransferase [Curtobacterium sp. ISL-83]
MTFTDEEPGEAEVPLLGGDVTEGIVRKGMTVRRPVGPASERVRRLLTALEQRGFDASPRHLGTDRAGRDVLTFLPGEVAVRPWPTWVGDDRRAASVARLLRRYDDAAEQVGLPAWATSTGPPDPPPVPSAGPPTLLGHRDVTPENVVFRDGEAAALIDFDLARPSARVEEVANLLLWWGAWMHEDDRQEAVGTVDPVARGALLVDAYGLDDASRRRIVPVSREIAERSWSSMQHRAETLGGGWRRMWDEGIGDVILRRQTWLAEHAAVLAAAVDPGGV